MGGEEQLMDRRELLDEGWLKLCREVAELGRKAGVSSVESLSM